VPLDADTYIAFKQAERRAKELGLSLAETLYRADLLITKQRRHDLEVQAVENLFRRLDRQNAAKLMGWFYEGRQAGTASEMFDATREWLHVVVTNWANETLEDL
jgi:hypothetical protein